MKLLIFTKYSRKGASSRLRSYQYASYFENKSIHVCFSPLFSDRYLNKIYNNKFSITVFFFGYLKRFLKLFSISEYDVIIIEKELFPYFPPIFEYLISKRKIPTIMDYDDAIFHNYDLHKNGLVRCFLKRKIDLYIYSIWSVSIVKFSFSHLKPCYHEKLSNPPLISFFKF